MDYQEKFKKVMLSQPHCILGKNKITEEFTAHVLKLLKRYKIIKVKALKSAIHDSSIKDLANRLSEKTGAYILDIRGKKFILSKYQLDKKN